MTGRYWQDLLTEEDSILDYAPVERQNYGYVILWLLLLLLIEPQFNKIILTNSNVM